MISIRNATAGDLADIQDISQHCLPITYRFTSYVHYFMKCPESCFVAVSDKIVGFVLGSMKGMTGNIAVIAVMKSHRKLGLATLLMKQSIAAMVENYGVSVITLHVKRYNTPAIKLYKSLGFVEVELKLDYYGPEDDAYLMEKYM